MKIDSLRIGYMDVPISLEDLHEDDCFGYFEAYPEPKIGLHVDMSPLYMAATGLHEVLEAISAIYGLDLAEAQVRTLETTIVDIVRRNPEYIRQWVEVVINGLSEEGKSSAKRYSSSKG